MKFELIEIRYFSQDESVVYCKVKDSCGNIFSGLLCIKDFLEKELENGN